VFLQTRSVFSINHLSELFKLPYKESSFITCGSLMYGISIPQTFEAISFQTESVDFFFKGNFRVKPVELNGIESTRLLDESKLATICK